MPSSLIKLGSAQQLMSSRFGDSRLPFGRHDSMSYSKLGIPRRLPVNGGVLIVYRCAFS